MPLWSTPTSFVPGVPRKFLFCYQFKSSNGSWGFGHVDVNFEGLISLTTVRELETKVRAELLVKNSWVDQVVMTNLIPLEV